MLISNAKTPEQARDDICDLLAQTQRERQRTADGFQHYANKERNQRVADELGALIAEIRGMRFGDFPAPKA